MSEVNKEILYKFFEGTASIEEGMKIKAWMEESPANKQTFHKERKLFDAILLNGKVSPDSRKVKNTPFRKITQSQWFRMAGIVILTLFINYLYQAYKNSRIEEHMCTISVPAGQRANITLPDGTNVWLNARTTMQYPCTFNNRQRTVTLNGEAYFDVSKDKNKPFVVQTKLYNIEVLGTKFNVNAYEEQKEFETALMQGHVRVISQTRHKQSINLSPEQKVFLENGKLHLAAIKDHDPYRWKEGLICFKETAFADIMKDFEKYYGIQIEIHNKNVLKYYFTGKFRQSDGIDYALRVLRNDISFDFEKDNEKQVIYIR